MDVLRRALAELDRPAPSLPDAPTGAPPDDQVPRRRGLIRAPASRPTETLSLEDARSMITTAITTYMADPLPESMLLIAAPAGIGKTTIAAWAAEQAAAEGRRVMYVGPRKAFFEDLQALATRPSWWYAWQARHGGDGETGYGATCRWPTQIAMWQARGYDARTFCSNPRICGWSYVRDSCRYYAQERRHDPIIYAQYEHIALGHLLLDQMHVVIGDELPIRAFLHPWHIPAAAIVPSGMAPDGPCALLTRLATLASVPTVTWQGAELLDALGGAAHVAQVCANASIDPSIDAFAPELRGPDDAEQAPYFHLPWTLALLAREAARAVQDLPSISRVRVDPSGLTLLLRRAPRALPPHVIWLDATANAPLYATLFQRPVRLVQPQVALVGQVRQVWAGLNNKRAVVGQHPKTDHLRRQIARILARGYTRPAYVSYKDLVRSLLPAEDAGEVAHFGGSRGTNRLQDCDCLIVVGAPQPSTAQLLDMAAMLYHERDEPFAATWTTRDRPYADQPWAWPIGGFWDDPQLQILLDQTREAELIQAIHRARPLIRAVDVWLLTNVPLDGLPVELISLAELFDAPEGVDPYGWPEVRALAETRLAATGMITTADLVAAGLCQQAAARRYLEALATQQGWHMVTAPAAGRGKPPLACVKHKQDRNIDLSPIRNS